MKKLLLLIALSLTAVLSAQVKVSEFQNGKVRCVKVENSFYTIVITPQIGGKILRYFDKISQTELVKLKALPTTPDQPIGHVGMLDDRSDFVMANYECAINTGNPGQVNITLTGYSQSTKVKLRKKLTFFDKSPVINVRYRYENHSKENITGFALGIRNLFAPSGDGVSADDRYFFPTTHTLRRLIGYSLKDESGESMPDMAAKLDTQLGAPYHALLNLKKRAGLAFSFEDDYYAGYHIWKGGIKYPTYEWTYRFLPAGHRHDTEFNIIQVNDMDSVAFASPMLLAGVKFDKSVKHNIKVATDLKFIQNPPKKLELQINCRAINWKWNAKPQKIRIKDIAALKNYTVNANIQVPGNGLYAVEQTLVSGRQVLATWSEAVTFGRFTTLPVFKINYRKITESAPIPGWESPQLPKMETTAADKERGFVILNAETSAGYTACPKVSMILGSNEYESKELKVFSLGYLGDIKLNLVNPDKFPARLRVERHITRKGSGSRPVICKILFDDKNFELEEDTSIWLTIGDKDGIKPGNYNFAIEASANNGQKITVPVEIKVLDAALPRRNFVNLEAEGYPTLFPGSTDKNILNTWYYNMRTHGIDFFQFVGRMGGRFISTKTLDHYIDNALASGLVIFKAARYNIAKPSDKEKENWHKLGAYLRSKGYQNKDMFIKILDEQPVEKYPAMGETGKWLKAAGFRPFSTFFNLFSRADSLRKLGGNFEMFQGGFTTRADYLARLKDGSLRPTDLYGRYTGTGTVTRSYNHMLRWGLEAAVLELPFFHNHEYMRGGNRKMGSNIVRVGDDSCPQDSVAFEALRDGMEVANFAALARRYLQLLPENGVKRAFENRFAKLFGKADSRFKIHQQKLMGVVNDLLVPMTTEEYTAGREELLALIADMKDELGDRTRLAALVWNGLTIAAPDAGSELIAETAEEKAAASLFKALIDKEVVCGNGKNGIKISFKIAPTEISYKITHDGKNITIQAANAANLEMGVRNWFNTFDVK